MLRSSGQSFAAVKEGHLSAIEEALLEARIPAGYNWSNISFPLFLCGNWMCFDLSKCIEAKKVQKEMRTRSPDRELVHQLLKYWSGQVYRISMYLTPWRYTHAGKLHATGTYLCHNTRIEYHMCPEAVFFCDKKKQRNCIRESFKDVLLILKTLTFKSGTGVRKSYRTFHT